MNILQQHLPQPAPAPNGVGIGVTIEHRADGIYYKVRVCYQGKALFLARFDDVVIARLAYDLAALHLKPNTTKTNYPAGTMQLTDPTALLMVHRFLHRTVGPEEAKKLGITIRALFSPYAAVPITHQQGCQQQQQPQQAPQASASDLGEVDIMQSHSDFEDMYMDDEADDPLQHLIDNISSCPNLGSVANLQCSSGAAAGAHGQQQQQQQTPFDGASIGQLIHNCLPADADRSSQFAEQYAAATAAAAQRGVAAAALAATAGVTVANAAVLPPPLGPDSRSCSTNSFCHPTISGSARGTAGAGGCEARCGSPTLSASAGCGSPGASLAGAAAVSAAFAGNGRFAAGQPAVMPQQHHGFVPTPVHVSGTAATAAAGCGLQQALPAAAATADVKEQCLAMLLGKQQQQQLDEQSAMGDLDRILLQLLEAPQPQQPYQPQQQQQQHSYGSSFSEPTAFDTACADVYEPAAPTAAVAAAPAPAPAVGRTTVAGLSSCADTLRFVRAGVQGLLSLNVALLSGPAGSCALADLIRWQSQYRQQLEGGPDADKPHTKAVLVLISKLALLLVQGPGSQDSNSSSVLANRSNILLVVEKQVCGLTALGAIIGSCQAGPDSNSGSLSPAMLRGWLSGLQQDNITPAGGAVLLLARQLLQGV